MILTELLTTLRQIENCHGGNCKIVIEHHGMLTSLRDIGQIKIKEAKFDPKDFVEDRGGFPVLKAGPSKTYPPPTIILEEGDKVQV